MKYKHIYYTAQACTLSCVLVWNIMSDAQTAKFLLIRKLSHPHLLPMRVSLHYLVQLKLEAGRWRSGKKRSIYIKKQLHSCLSLLILLLLNTYGRTGVTNAQNWFSSYFLDAKSEPNQQHIVLFPIFIYLLVGNSGWVLLQGCYFFPQTFIVNDMTAGIVKEHYFLCQLRCFQATLSSWVSIKSLNGADLR